MIVRMIAHIKVFMFCALDVVSFIFCFWFWMSYESDADMGNRYNNWHSKND